MGGGSTPAAFVVHADGLAVQDRAQPQTVAG